MIKPVVSGQPRLAAHGAIDIYPQPNTGTVALEVMVSGNWRQIRLLTEPLAYTPRSGTEYRIVLTGDATCHVYD